MPRVPRQMCDTAGPGIQVSGFYHPGQSPPRGWKAEGLQSQGQGAPHPRPSPSVLTRVWNLWIVERLSERLDLESGWGGKELSSFPTHGAAISKREGGVGSRTQNHSLLGTRAKPELRDREEEEGAREMWRGGEGGVERPRENFLARARESTHAHSTTLRCFFDLLRKDARHWRKCMKSCEPVGTSSLGKLIYLASTTSLSRSGLRGNRPLKPPSETGRFLPVFVSKETNSDYRAPRGTNLAGQNVALSTPQLGFKYPSAGPAHYPKKLCPISPLFKAPSLPSHPYSWLMILLPISLRKSWGSRIHITSFTHQLASFLGLGINCLLRPSPTIAH